MQSAALAELGLADWTYEAIEVSPDDFAELVRSLPGRGFRGVNVTVPHKLAALELADEATDAARSIGAANTLSFEGGSIAAHNTDAQGIVEALPRSPAGRTALVLGAGGSARAAIWGLGKAGAKVSVWNRTPEKAAALAAEFGVAHHESGPSHAQLVVNATSVGLGAEGGGNPLSEQGEPDLKPFPPFDDGIQAEVVVDLVYGSKQTELIRAAKAARAVAIDGLEVLVRQGAASLETWTGMEAPVETMRRAARGEP
jgi:shikimate dehydrogenase